MNPIGVAAYQLQSKLPADLKGKLPTAKQLADVVRTLLPEGAPVMQYLYRYQPPTPAKELLAEFWKLEKQAEKMLGGWRNEPIRIQ